MTVPYLHPRRRRALLNWSIADTLFGLVLLLGPPARVSSHAFDPAKAVAPMPVWGAVALALGVAWTVIALTASRYPWPLAGYLIAIPAALLASWHLFFWTSLLFAAAIPTVGLTGCIAYLAIAINHILFAIDQV